MKQDNIQREFIVGDNWLYYKIYTGEKTSDYILEKFILPITKDLLNKKIIQKWFFIRYQDPDHHIRLRLFCEDKSNIGCVISTFQPLFYDLNINGLIWSLQTDTYKREIERYGEKSIELTELYFYHESQIILEFLKLNKDIDIENVRWLFGLKILDALLDTFKLDFHNKVYLIRKIKTSFGDEFGIDRFLKRQIDDKFRIYKNSIVSFLEKKSNDDIEELLLNYKNNITPIINELIILNKEKKIEVNFDNLIFSYLHMFMNRLFKSKNRQHELILYNFLYRYYRLVAGRDNIDLKVNNY